MGSDRSDAETVPADKSVGHGAQADVRLLSVTASAPACVGLVQLRVVAQGQPLLSKPASGCKVFATLLTGNMFYVLRFVGITHTPGAQAPLPTTPTSEI